MTVAQRMTAEEFLELPLDRDEYGFAPCLVEGELVVNRPDVWHQETGGRIFVELRNWIEGGQGRGYAIYEIDVLIDDLNVYEPDVLWYAEGRGPRRVDRAPHPVPDLAVEVRSPSTWRHDVGAKKAGYERGGVQELWLVDTAAGSVLVFRRSAPDGPAFDIALELTAGDTLGSPLLEHFELPLDRLFAGDY
ncbi:MAG TPA: Uma2 family endonuclease [Thermoleophilaceae bacterium]